jgi:hypothetical protein
MLIFASGGVAASWIAVALTGNELLVAGLSAAATLVFFAIRAASKARSCGTTCAIDASCCGGGRSTDEAGSSS